MTDWRIVHKEERCAGCGREFAEEEALYSILRVGPERLEREDRCPACFRAEDDEAEPTLRVWWRTRRRPHKGRRLAVDFEAVEGLFMALEGREEERLQELRYLLCLLLMRKKRLKLVRVQRTAGEERMLLRRPRRTEEIAVRVFDLTSERAAALKEELERIVEGAGSEDLSGALEGAVQDTPETAAGPATDPSG